jgi:hypothetical protein
MQVCDPLVWLSFATVPDEATEREYIESIHNFVTYLPRWCASNRLPVAVSDESMVHAIKHLWTDRWVRAPSRKSFENYWSATMMSTDVDTVMRYCVPQFSKPLKE